MLENFKCVSFNSYGFKSSSAFIKELCENNEVVFICEHWLNMHEISQIQNQLNNDGYWSTLKTPMNPELIQHGRSFGGVGFIGRKLNNVTYKIINVDSDRICAIEILYDTQSILTIIGVYMPFHNDKRDRCELYIETLDVLQGLLDIQSGNIPIMWGL